MKIIKEREFDEDGRTITNAEGQCDCGAIVELGRFTCTCRCGRDYNWNGTLLAPREQWGEETGETAADILGPMTPEERDDFLLNDTERLQDG
jgi:hypothetical protein